MIFSLFAIFLAVFGFPAFFRFKSGGILTATHDENIDSMILPRITVCPRNPQTYSKLGWKGNLTTGYESISEGPCAGSENAKELEVCIETHVYKKEEIFDSAVNLSLWEDYYSFLFFGKCFVLSPAVYTIGFSQLDALSIALNKSLEYMILLHDPDFMMITGNPTVVPRLIFSIDANFGEKTVYIEATKHIKMNRKSSPCTEEAAYSFHDCVRKSIAVNVGCNSLFGYFSGLKKCSSVDQLISYEEIYGNFALMDQRNITNHTGCGVPCVFTTFSLTEEPFSSVGFEPKLGLDIMFGRRSITVAKEELIYPLNTFIAEIGGSLGLFLGFSFLMGFDFLQEAYIKFKEYFK